jgi:hypothetical protein
MDDSPLCGVLQTVGNLLPGQTAIISITCVADLKIEGEDVRYFLPTFVAPRYTPRTETDPIHTGTVRRVLNGLQFRAQIDMTDTITAVSSPSHTVAVQHAAGSKSAVVDLAHGTTQLDKDLVLLVRTANPHQPRVCVEVSADGSVATMITLAPNIELDEQKCELIFVVDRSGSMSGSKIDQARKAMNVRVLMCVSCVCA